MLDFISRWLQKGFHIKLFSRDIGPKQGPAHDEYRELCKRAHERYRREHETRAYQNYQGSVGVPTRKTKSGKGDEENG